MKLKYLFPLFIATLLLAMSCAEEEVVTLLDEIQVSSSYVAIPEGGGSTSITVTATGSWTAEKVTTDKDPVEWLTLSTTSGSAGESQLTFSAKSTIDGRAAEVLIHSGGKTQRINVMQGLMKIATAKAAEVNSAPDGKSFRVTGVCTKITNTLYGNWYLTDETGEVFIYGTLDKKGDTKNFLSWGMEVGDEVTIEGPKSSYKGDPQMVNVTVVKINKSLIKVDSVENEVLPMEGGEFTAFLICKGEGVSVDIPEDAKSWLAISSIQSKGENVVVKFIAMANEGGDRETTLTFHTVKDSKKYSTETVLTQKGAIVKATVAEFLAAPVGNIQYRLSGAVTKIDNNNDGRLYLRDFSGETYVYKIQDYTANSLKVGDIITLVGKRAEYKGNPQMSGAVLENVIPVTPATIAEVLTKPVDKNVYFMITASIKEIQNQDYGNIVLKEGDSEILMYGCYPGYGATGDDRKGLINAKGIKAGDNITVIATRGEYGGTPQLSNGFYLSHESGDIQSLSIAEFLAAPVGDTRYRLSGAVAKIDNNNDGRLYLRDYSGEAYVFKIQDYTANSLKEGDIITLVGKRAEYNDNPQMSGAVLEEVKAVTAVTIAEVLAKPVDKNVYFMITASITEIQNDVYGNIVLKEGDSEILMYGCYPGYGATGDDRKGLINAKGIKVGDMITVIATRGEYKGTPQLANGFYFSHESAE